MLDLPVMRDQADAFVVARRMDAESATRRHFLDGQTGFGFHGKDCKSSSALEVKRVCGLVCRSGGRGNVPDLNVDRLREDSQLMAGWAGRPVAESGSLAITLISNWKP